MKGMSGKTAIVSGAASRSACCRDGTRRGGPANVVLADILKRPDTLDDIASALTAPVSGHEALRLPEARMRIS